MQVYPAFSVLLHRSVLGSSFVRDTLLRTYARGLYRAHWTDKCLAQLDEDLRTGDGTTAGITTTLRDAFPEAFIDKALYDVLLQGAEETTEQRFLVAAAMSCRAQVIVMADAAQFSTAPLDRTVLEAQDPDTFLSHLVDLDPDAVLRVIVEQAADHRRPERTIVDLLDALGESVPNFTDAVRRLLPSQLAGP